MTAETLLASRYQGDTSLLETLKADEVIGRQLEVAGTGLRRSDLRVAMLARYVRVDPKLIPTVYRAFQNLEQRAGIDVPMEAYVYQGADINAMVIRGRSHIFVALSSGAVNILDEEELEFVIGHELGHAVFGHIDVPDDSVLANTKLDPRRRMQLRAWSRAAEISSDRAGLICCGDLDAAARALFKVLSGLSLDGLSVTPADLAAQWDHLANEVVETGHAEHWQLSHPFPHLRMKALMLFWDAGLAGRGAAADPAAKAAVDREVSRLLALMDPLARENPEVADPVLADFFLWGGLYMAMTHGPVGGVERAKLAAVTSPDKLEEVLEAGIGSAEDCLNRFSDCITRRSEKLTAAEIFRIMEGLTYIATADDDFAESERNALKAIAERLGVKAELFISRHTD